MYDDDPDDPNRRDFLGALAFAVPAIGGVAELIARAARRPARIEATKAAARPFVAEDPELPLDALAEAAASREDRQR